MVQKLFTILTKELNYCLQIALASVEASSNDALHKTRKQSVYIFEGTDLETKNVASSTKVSVPSPIGMLLQ